MNQRDQGRGYFGSQHRAGSGSHDFSGNRRTGRNENGYGADARYNDDRDYGRSRGDGHGREEHRYDSRQDALRRDDDRFRDPGRGSQWRDFNPAGNTDNGVSYRREDRGQRNPDRRESEGSYGRSGDRDDENRQQGRGGSMDRHEDQNRRQHRGASYGQGAREQDHSGDYFNSNRHSHNDARGGWQGGYHRSAGDRYEDSGFRGRDRYSQERRAEGHGGRDRYGYPGRVHDDGNTYRDESNWHRTGYSQRDDSYNTYGSRHHRDDKGERPYRHRD